MDNGQWEGVRGGYKDVAVQDLCGVPGVAEGPDGVALAAFTGEVGGVMEGVCLDRHIPGFADGAGGEEKGKGKGKGNEK